MPISRKTVSSTQSFIEENKQSHLFRRNRLVRLVCSGLEVQHASLLQLWVEAQWFCAACCLKCCLQLPLYSARHFLHGFGLGRARRCSVHRLPLRIYKHASVTRGGEKYRTVEVHVRKVFCIYTLSQLSPRCTQALCCRVQLSSLLL